MIAKATVIPPITMPTIIAVFAWDWGISGVELVEVLREEGGSVHAGVGSDQVPTGSVQTGSDSCQST
jgi:hypothetical protein